MINNQAPRVLIFSMAYLPLIGGAELAVKEITDRISDGFCFDLIAARLDKKLAKFERIGKINVYRVGHGWVLDKYLYPWLAYFKAKKLHKQRRYQIVQALMASYGGITALFFKKRFPRIKYLLTLQSGDTDLFFWTRTWFWHPLYKQVYTKADYIQAISLFLAQRARKYGYRGKIEIAPNGVDLTKFLIQNYKPQINSKLQVQNSKEKIIITVSRLVKKNGLDDLIKAVKDLPVKLLIFGAGPDEQKLKDLAKKLKIEDKIEFRGHIDHKDLPKHLAQADIFVRPSLSEGLGNAFLEAMAAGLPIIGTPVGGIVDFLKDRKTGLFCQARSPQSIAEKIREILSSHQLRLRLIKNGRQLVEERYSWDKISQKMKQIYMRLIQ